MGGKETELRKRGKKRVVEEDVDVLDGYPESLVVTRKRLGADAPFYAKVMQFLFTVVVIHYLYWSVPLILAVWYMYQLGGILTLIILLSIYMPSFFDYSQLKLGRPWPSLRKARIWKLAQSYMKVEVVRLKALHPESNYIFGIYPHGILILSRVASYAGLWETLFPGIDFRVLGATPMFWIPGARELCLWLNAVDAGKRTAANCLKNGKSVVVYPGGSSEIFKTDPDSTKTTLVQRKGFIKLALETGTPLVPVFVFGEKWMYSRKHVSQGVQDWFMNTLKTPIILFWGKCFTWLPYQTEHGLNVVYGEPIDVEKIENPTSEDINKLHAEFMAKIVGLFDKFKGRYGYSDEETLELS